MRDFRICAIVCALIASTAVLWAAEEGATTAEDRKGGAAAMMEAWMKLATPGPQHEKLKTLAGKFDADVTMQMMPDMPEEKSKGKAVNEMIFDGRYLKGEYTGTMNGKPFQGIGYWGFDNLKQKYFMSWMDSMSTMMMVAEGTADEAGKVFTFNGECLDPVSKKKMPIRQVLTIEDEDHHTYESYRTGTDGKEFKDLTVKYTRAK